MPRKKKQPETTEVLASSLESLADNIAQLSKVGREIKASRLNEKAILTLLKEMTGESKHSIKLVLDALPELEKTYLKKR